MIAANWNTRVPLALERDRSYSAKSCGNPECRSGWVYAVLRRRMLPRFEGHWACTPSCMEQIIARSVRTEIENWEYATPERPLRMPLGLILLSRGWITQRELQKALQAQRESGSGRIGEWIRKLHGLSGETIAKALAVQWNCAVLTGVHAGIEFAPQALPAALQRHYGLLVLKQQADGALFLVGRSRADHAAARALEHIWGRPVVLAFVSDDLWREWDEPLDEAGFEESSPEDGAAAAIQRHVERVRPAAARLVRMHNHLWLRMWQNMETSVFEDLVLPLRGRSTQSLGLNAS